MINSNTAFPSHFNQIDQGHQPQHPLCQHRNFQAPQQNQQPPLQQPILNMLLPILAQLISQLGQGQPTQNQTPQNQANPNQSANCTCSPQSQSGGLADLLADVAQVESQGLTRQANIARSNGFTDTAQFLDAAALGAQHGNPLQQISSPGQPSPEAILEGFLKPAQFGLNNLLADVHQAQSEDSRLKAELELVSGRPLQGNAFQELSRDAARGRLIRNHQIDPSVFSSPLPEGLNSQQQAEVLAQRAGKEEIIPRFQGQQPAASDIQSQQVLLASLLVSLIAQFLPQISAQ